jgi:hypothetical protein
VKVLAVEMNEGGALVRPSLLISAKPNHLGYMRTDWDLVVLPTVMVT